jgi:hypothetical protein
MKGFQHLFQLASLPENADDPILLRIAMDLKARDVPELLVRLYVIAPEGFSQPPVSPRVRKTG